MAGKGRVLLVLDEIQKVRGWSEVVKRLWDEEARVGGKVRPLLLGSSALLVQKGLTESLAGRFYLHRCTHWSWPECRDAFGWALERWIYFGGYPGAAPLAGDEPAWQRYVTDALIETVIARDVLQMQTVTKPALLRHLFALAAAYPAQILSYTKMLGQLQDAGNTVTLAAYLRLLETAFLASGLEIHAKGQVRRRGSSPKLILWNNALVNAPSSLSFRQAQADGAWWGRLVENAVGAPAADGARTRQVRRQPAQAATRRSARPRGGDGGNPQGHCELAVRRAAGVRHHREECARALQGDVRKRILLRRRNAAFHGHREYFPARPGIAEGEVPDASQASGRVILTGAVVRIEDSLLDPSYDQRLVAAGSWRRMLGVPMLREGAPVGVIVVTWEQPGPVLKHHEQLLQTFADQAVIAIENVRLFKDTKEALERQTATAEILKVISRSVEDTTPVFEAIVAACARLFPGHNIGVNVLDEDGGLYVRAAYPPADLPALNEHFNSAPERRAGCQFKLRRTVLQFPDLEGADIPADVLAGCRVIGAKAIVFAPLVLAGEGIGSIYVARVSAGLFSDKEVALLDTFAEQAVIAIQNARLFREIVEKGKQLEEASRHKSDFLASMSHELRTPLNAILGFNEMILGQVYGEVPADMQEPLNDIQTSGKHLLRLINNVLDLAKIEAGRVEIAVAEKGDLLRFSVTDTGIGIPPDKIASLFTEFKQTDATIASEYGGTGLGLSISKKFVEMHGGRIWVESEFGKGSAFIIEIPLRAKTT